MKRSNSFKVKDFALLVNDIAGKKKRIVYKYKGNSRAQRQSVFSSSHGGNLILQSW